MLALQTTDETPLVASVTLAPDFDGYLFAIMMDSSWNETLCPLMRPPTALARRRANAMPMSHGLCVFLLIDSQVARVIGARTSVREKRNSCASSPQVRMTTRTCYSPLLDTRAQSSISKCAMFDSRLCLFTLLTQAGCKLEVNDSMAQLWLPEKWTLDLDLVGSTLWLELWDPRPFVRGANMWICLVSHGNSSRSRWETVSEAGGVVIKGSRTGTGETGRLRIDPKLLVVDEIEAEQDTVQVRVCKGPVLPIADQVMKPNLSFRDWCVLCIAGKHQIGRIRESPILQQRYRGVNSVAVPQTSWPCWISCIILWCLTRAVLWQGTSKPLCASGYDIHGFLGSQEDLFANRWEPASGAPAQAIKIARNDATPRYSSSSLGAVARSNRSVEGEIRCMRIALEKSADKSFGIEDNILVWLCRHAGWLITRIHVQTDGFTPYQRLKGKPWSGEQVYVPPCQAVIDGLDRWPGLARLVVATRTWQSQQMDAQWSCTGRYDGFFSVNDGRLGPWHGSRWLLGSRNHWAGWHQAETTAHHMGNAATVRIADKLSELRGRWWSSLGKLSSPDLDKEEARELRALAGELGRLSGEVGAAEVDADASTATHPHPVREPETTITTATQVTQSSVPTVPATQSPSTDAPMETFQTTTEPRHDLDVRMAERHPKRRRELDDVEMTAVLAQPASERTYEVCALLVRTDIADNNYIEGGLVNENTERWQPRGQLSAQPCESWLVAARAAQERHDRVWTQVRSTPSWWPSPWGTWLWDWADGRSRNVWHRCTRRRMRQASEGQVAQWLENERNEISLGRSAVQLGKKWWCDTGPHRLQVSKASSFARCLAGWECSVAFYHSPLDEEIVVMDSCGKIDRTWTAREKQAWHWKCCHRGACCDAAPFAEVVVAPMSFYRKGIDVAMIVHGDDFFAEGRAEALLQVNEYQKNKFRINLVSLAGPGHWKEVQFETGLVMRGMSTSRVLNEARLYRAVRYIAEVPGVDWLFRW